MPDLKQMNEEVTRLIALGYPSQWSLSWDVIGLLALTSLKKQQNSFPVDWLCGALAVSVPDLSMPSEDIMAQKKVLFGMEGIIQSDGGQLGFTNESWRAYYAAMKLVQEIKRCNGVDGVSPVGVPKLVAETIAQQFMSPRYMMVFWLMIDHLKSDHAFISIVFDILSQEKVCENDIVGEYQAVLLGVSLQSLAIAHSESYVLRRLTSVLGKDVLERALELLVGRFNLWYSFYKQHGDGGLLQHSLFMQMLSFCDRVSYIVYLDDCNDVVSELESLNQRSKYNPSVVEFIGVVQFFPRNMISQLIEILGYKSCKSVRLDVLHMIAKQPQYFSSQDGINALISLIKDDDLDISDGAVAPLMALPNVLKEHNFFFRSILPFINSQFSARVRLNAFRVLSSKFFIIADTDGNLEDFLVAMQNRDNKVLRDAAVASMKIFKHAKLPDVVLDFIRDHIMQEEDALREVAVELAVTCDAVCEDETLCNHIEACLHDSDLLSDSVCDLISQSDGGALAKRLASGFFKFLRKDVESRGEASHGELLALGVNSENRRVSSAALSVAKTFSNDQENADQIPVFITGLVAQSIHAVGGFFEGFKLFPHQAISMPIFQSAMREWGQSDTTSKMLVLESMAILKDGSMRNRASNREEGHIEYQVEADGNCGYTALKNGSMRDQAGNRQEGYIRHKVEADGNCGYTAFGMTRDEAYQRLQANLNSIRNILQQAVAGALLEVGFYQSLISNEQIPSNIEHAVITENIEQYVGNLTVLQGYLDYDVRDKHIDAGWAHPCILQALAHIQNIELRIWTLGEQDVLMPHRVHDEDYSVYVPPNAQQRNDLLFINGNHFELLTFSGYQDGIPNEGIYPLSSTQSLHNRIPSEGIGSLNATQILNNNDFWIKRLYVLAECLKVNRALNSLMGQWREALKAGNDEEAKSVYDAMIRYNQDLRKAALRTLQAMGSCAATSDVMSAVAVGLGFDSRESLKCIYDWLRVLPKSTDASIIVAALQVILKDGTALFLEDVIALLEVLDISEFREFFSKIIYDSLFNQNIRIKIVAYRLIEAIGAALLSREILEKLAEDVLNKDARIAVACCRAISKIYSCQSVNSESHDMMVDHIVMILNNIGEVVDQWDVGCQKGALNVIAACWSFSQDKPKVALRALFVVFPKILKLADDSKDGDLKFAAQKCVASFQDAPVSPAYLRALLKFGLIGESQEKLQLGDRAISLFLFMLLSIRHCLGLRILLNGFDKDCKERNASKAVFTLCALSFGDSWYFECHWAAVFQIFYLPWDIFFSRSWYETFKAIVGLIHKNEQISSSTKQDFASSSVPPGCMDRDLLSHFDLYGSPVSASLDHRIFRLFHSDERPVCQLPFSVDSDDEYLDMEEPELLYPTRS